MPLRLQTMSKTVMMAKTAKGAQKQAAKTIKQAASTVKGAASRTTKGASKTARKTVRCEPQLHDRPHLNLSEKCFARLSARPSRAQY